METLDIGFKLPVEACNAGLFISSGFGSHPVRTIDSYEIIFVNSGTLEMFEQDREFRLNQGDSLLLWPGRKHGGLGAYPPDLSFYWLHFRLKSADMTGGFSIPQTASIGRTERMTELFRFYLDEQERSAAPDEGKACLIYMILLEISAGQCNATDTQGAIIANKARNFIDINFRQELGTSDIAASLKCNPDYLGRVFRHTYGITITDYLHSVRIRAAKKFILAGAMNINETASACGFQDTVYFRRIFKRLAGMSPGQYRKLYSQLHVNTE